MPSWITHLVTASKISNDNDYIELMKSKLEESIKFIKNHIKDN